MDDWKHLTAQNAEAWREQVFAALRAKPKPDEEDLERVRSWIREAVKPDSHLAQLYRVLELDLERSIIESLPAFQRSPYFGRLEAHYSLRMLWRVLFRRYALHAAWKVARQLARDENAIWTLWRLKDFLFPRLAVGVLLGFFSLGSSSAVVETFYHLRTLTPWWLLVPVASVLLVFLVACADVQRRAGRIPAGWIALRAAWVVCWGIVYAALGAWAHWWRAGIMGYHFFNYWPVSVMCGGVALLLGFVFQLFWQDRSIGEPL